MATGTVFEIRRYCIHDGPGIRTTVFLKGCPGRCAWCHNPESQYPGLEVIHRPSRCKGCRECLRRCPNGAIVRLDGGLTTVRDRCSLCMTCVAACPWGARNQVGRVVRDAQVVDDIVKDTVFFDESGGGATFSGGEPLMQQEFLHALLDGCRARGVHTVVDTSGFVDARAIVATAPRADLFLYDLKLVDAERHLRLTGTPAEVVLHNLKVLSRFRGKTVVRVPVIPGVNEDQMEPIIGFLASLGRERPTRVDLLAYHGLGEEKYRRLGRAYGLPRLKAPAPELMVYLQQEFTRHGFDARIGGQRA